jgi:hypothetical protein
MVLETARAEQGDKRRKAKEGKRRTAVKSLL